MDVVHTLQGVCVGRGEGSWGGAGDRGAGGRGAGGRGAGVRGAGGRGAGDSVNAIE